VNAFLWICFALGLLASASHFWFQRRALQFFDSNKTMPYFKYDVNIHAGAPLATLALLPHAASFGLCWPLALLVGMLTVARLVAQKRVALSESGLTALLPELKSISSKWPWRHSWIYPAWAVALGALLIATPGARTPLVVWLGSLWVALLCWLLSMRLLGMTAAQTLRVTSPTSFHAVLSGTLIYLLALPVSGAFFSEALFEPAPLLPGVLERFASVFSLGGALWDGLGSALSRMRSSPTESILVVTGLSLYWAGVSGLISLVLKKPTDNDLRRAASVQLAYGNTSSAGQLLDGVSEEDPELHSLRIAVDLMREDLDSAAKILEVKFPVVTELASSKHVAIWSCLLLYSLIFRIRDRSQERLLARFFHSNPTQEEILVLRFLLYRANNVPGFAYADASFLAESLRREFHHSAFVLAVASRASEEVGELLPVVRVCCSVNPGVQLAAESILFEAKFREESAEGRMKVLQSGLQDLEQVFEPVASLAGLLLSLVSLTLLQSSEAASCSEFAHWRDSMVEKIRGRVLLLPSGQFIWSRLLRHHELLKR
jgi:hypothetical protein